MSDPGRRQRLGVLLLALTSMAAGADRIRAQDDVQGLAERCSAGTLGSSSQICREGALALQAGHAAVGLLAAGGAQITGAASTLGRRFGGFPRLSLVVRGGVARVGIPDVERGFDSGGGSSTAFATQLALAAGLLDGFSLAPTVGGIFSLDAFATAGALFLPSARGFEGSVGVWGAGVNVGLLRESFTLPGVTVSLARRSVGEVRLGDRGSGDAVEVTFDPAITSARLVVGKDLLALGVLGGLGWDRYSGDAAVRTSASVTDANDFVASRRLFFGGVSLNLLLLQLAAEAGYARGFDPYPGRPDSEYDPENGSLFLFVAGRLTL